MMLPLGNAQRLFLGATECRDLWYQGEHLWGSNLLRLLDSAAAPAPAGNVAVMHRPWEAATLVGYVPETGVFSRSVNARSDWADGDLLPVGGAIISDGYFQLGNIAGRRVSLGNMIDAKGRAVVLGVRVGLVAGETYLISSGGSDIIRFQQDGSGISLVFRAGGGVSRQIPLNAFDPDRWHILMIYFANENLQIRLDGRVIIDEPYEATHWNIRHFGWHNDSQQPVHGIAGPIIINDTSGGDMSPLVPVAQDYLTSVLETLHD